MSNTTLTTDKLMPSLLSFPQASAACQQSADRLRAQAQRCRQRGAIRLAQTLEAEAQWWLTAASELQGTRQPQAA